MTAAGNGASTQADSHEKWWTYMPTWITAAAAVAALFFTGLSLGATRDQLAVSEQGQVSDRFGKAIEQLGRSDSLELRLGGLYGLERLMKDSPPDQPAIVEVVSAFVRQHAPRFGKVGVPPKCDDSTQVDIQAAVTILGRRNTVADKGTTPDLSGSCLTAVRLTRARLNNVNLNNTDLTGSTIEESILSGANLDGAVLSNSSLKGTSFTTASMQMTILDQAILTDANLSGANLKQASLKGVKISNANLTGANLAGVIGKP